MDPAKEQVLVAVSDCLSRLVSGSGHVASFIMKPDGFCLTGSNPGGDGLIEYTFTARGIYETEFLPRDPGNVGAEEIAGSIVLDSEFGLTFDERGRVRVVPGPCLHPSRWDRLDDPAVQAEDAEAMVTPA